MHVQVSYFPISIVLSMKQPRLLCNNVLNEIVLFYSSPHSAEINSQNRNKVVFKGAFILHGS